MALAANNATKSDSPANSSPLPRREPTLITAKEEDVNLSTSPQPLILRELTNNASSREDDKVESVVKRIEMEVGRMEGQEEDMEVDVGDKGEQQVERVVQEQVLKNDEVTKTGEVPSDEITVDSGAETSFQDTDLLPAEEPHNEETSKQTVIKEAEVVQSELELPKPANNFEMSAPIMYEARASSTHVVKMDVGSHQPENYVSMKDMMMEVDSIPAPSTSPRSSSNLVGPKPFSKCDEARISPVRMDDEQEEEEEVELRPKKRSPVPKPRSIIYERSLSNNVENVADETTKDEEEKSSSLPPTVNMDLGEKKRLTFALEDSTAPKRAKNGSSLSDDRIGARQLKGGLKLSSTTSLHIQPDDDLKNEQDEDEQPLQRRNSIHNVPFVDVSDPGTRERMERYKEERRSMLRAKYKVEDYVTKKESPKAEDEQKKIEPESVISTPPKEKQKEKSVSPKPASRSPKVPQQKPQTSKNSVPLRRMPVESPAVRKWSAPSSRTKAATPSPESNKRMSTPPRKTSEPPTARPRSTLTASRTSPKVARRTNLNTSRGKKEEEEVNVKQRAAIFGGGTNKEVNKTKTVSHANNRATSLNTGLINNNVRKRSPVGRSGVAAKTKSMTVSSRTSSKVSSDGPSSPSKIKNMTAIFEQRQN